MNIQFGDESDSSDEDYVPTGPGNGGEVPSEVDSDGDPEDPLSGGEESPKKGVKRRKRTKKSKKVPKPEAPKEDSSDSAKCSPEKKELTEEELKKRTDSIWADFKKETSFKAKPKPSLSSEKVSNDITKTEVKKEEKKVPEKVKVTQIFEFAGEEVKIEKEVPVGSAEARLTSSSSTSSPLPPTRGRGKGKGLGGIGSVLSQLGKKQKLSTLEKSKLDWNKFKREEKIEDELESYKKGKDGYLEKQDFLQRADLRTFEIEKEIRTVERNKRMNMNNLP